MNSKLQKDMKAKNRNSELLHLKEEYSGPIPHPNILKQFEEVISGSADRILKMAEKEQEHRHEFENKIISHKKIMELTGLIFGFLLALIIIGGGIYLLLNDKSAKGFVLILGGIGTIITPFIFSKTKNK